MFLRTLPRISSFIYNKNNTKILNLLSSSPTDSTFSTDYSTQELQIFESLRQDYEFTALNSIIKSLWIELHLEYQDQYFYKEKNHYLHEMIRDSMDIQRKFFQIHGNQQWNLFGGNNSFPSSMNNNNNMNKKNNGKENLSLGISSSLNSNNNNNPNEIHSFDFLFSTPELYESAMEMFNEIYQNGTFSSLANQLGIKKQFQFNNNNNNNENEMNEKNNQNNKSKNNKSLKPTKPTKPRQSSEINPKTPLETRISIQKSHSTGISTIDFSLSEVTPVIFNHREIQKLNQLKSLQEKFYLFQQWIIQKKQFQWEEKRKLELLKKINGEINNKNNTNNNTNNNEGNSNLPVEPDSSSTVMDEKDESEADPTTGFSDLLNSKVESNTKQE